MSTLEHRLQAVTQKIENALKSTERPLDDLQLIVVTKTVDVSRIQSITNLGHLSLGENRVQELLSKKDLLPPTIHWHLIGQLQSNKIRKILPYVEAIHSVDTPKLAKDISRIAGELKLTANIFLEVNVGGELSKIGFEPSDLLASFQEISQLPHLKIQGLMCIPPPCEENQNNRQYFAFLRNLKLQLEQTHHVPLPYLSMGMSDDFEDAILEGATHIRVGSAIFGARDYK